MQNTLLSVLALSSVVFAAACSVESTSPPSSSSSGNGSETPSSSSSSTDPSQSSSSSSSSSKTPAKTEDPKEEDTEPKTPPKPFFDATIDGDPAVFDEITIELDDGTYELVGVVNATSPYGSDQTLTVRFAKGQTGAGACASGERSVDLWYKDGDDGVIRGIGTGYLGGGCSMTLDTSIAGYVSGQAQGTLGGAKQKSFSVKFAQKLP